MQFGTREEFDYVECPDCGSVQIAEIPSPEDLARHYPEAYYSFNAASGRLRSWLWRHQDRAAAGRFDPLGSVLGRLRPDSTIRLLLGAGISRNHRVLDVGSGRGHLLDRFADLGFTQLTGIDPFLDGDLTTDKGVQIRKQTMSELTGTFDAIMFNHSLEHVPSPEADLRLAREHLAEGGLCLVRLPTTDSVGWAEHGVHWASMDPPRHLVLPSRRGLEETAARAGLEHVRTVDDSHWLQYQLSELYAQGIAATDPEALTALSPKEQKRFEEKADRANQEGRGDQALFIFRRPAATAEVR